MNLRSISHAHGPPPSHRTRLGVNVFTAPGKAMVGEPPRPNGQPHGFCPATSTLIFGEHDAVLVDAMTTVAEAEALADWIALHNRNLETIYITHAHFDHFYGLSVLLDRFPGAQAIATPKAVEGIRMYLSPSVQQLARRKFPGQVPTKLVGPEPYEGDTFTLEGHELRIIGAGRTDCPDSTSSTRSIDRRDRRWHDVAVVQPVPHVRRRHHSRKPAELDRGARPVSGAEPGDCCRRSQDAWRARLSLDDPGHQALPCRILIGYRKPRTSGPGAVRSDDGAISALGSQSVVADVWIPAVIEPTSSATARLFPVLVPISERRTKWHQKEKSWH